MILETKRLFIRAMNYDDLVRYLKDESPFSDSLTGLSENEIDDELRPVLSSIIIKNVKLNRDDYLFFTLWLVIEKKFNLSVGSIMFKGRPGNDGKVELGYGTHEEFQNRGYMTEAVGAITDWALKSGKVSAVIAETAKDNPASFGVLEKNNFSKFRETGEFYYWIKENG